MLVTFSPLIGFPCYWNILYFSLITGSNSTCTKPLFTERRAASFSSLGLLSDCPLFFTQQYQIWSYWSLGPFILLKQMDSVRTTPAWRRAIWFAAWPNYFWMELTQSTARGGGPGGGWGCTVNGASLEEECGPPATPHLTAMPRDFLLV